MDERFMRLALEEAQKAYSLGEAPVGAVLVRQGEVIARARNRMEAEGDATAHAELNCIREASRVLGARLNDCTLYCTMEPCAMCAGAAILARIPRVVFGAFDRRAGCCGSVLDITDNWLPQRAEVIGGVLESECAQLLTQFFRERRRKGLD